MSVMDASFFTGNRRALRQSVEADLIIVAGNDELQRKADAAYEFAQDANFYYLTGVEEAGWVLVIDGDREVLVSPSRSESQVLFDGALSAECAKDISGVGEVIDLAEYRRWLNELSKAHSVVALVGKDPYSARFGFTLNSGPEKVRRSLTRRFGAVEDIRPTLRKLRSIKQPAEIALIRRAVDASVVAFQHVAEAMHTFSSENEITAQLSYDFLRASSGGHAYTPIVAGGGNACTLHYIDNNQKLPENGLVLIDAGVQVENYASDITRTYAVGTATLRQKQIHAAVEKAHHEIIQLIKPGVSLTSYSDDVDEIMKSALIEVGLLADRSDVKTYRTYFPHAISHGLGIDVHDSLGGYETFMPGMVLTVEPGIYIPEEGIGVRIEDDILVTEHGHENLSAALPTAL